MTEKTEATVVDATATVADTAAAATADTTATDSAAAAAAPDADVTDTSILTDGVDDDAPADADTDKPDGKKEDAPGDSDANDGEEEYQFTAPEGLEVSDAFKEAFTPIFRELKLKNEGAQKLVDAFASTILPKMSAQISESIVAQNAIKHAEMVKQWRKDAEADPDFGGAHFTENAKLANKAFKRFGADGMATIINDYGLGNHPAVLKTFAAIGKLISEDSTLVRGDAAAQAAPKRAADIMYGP